MPRSGARNSGCGLINVGFGDNLMASGLARGAAARGKRVALGDGKTIIWDQHSQHVFSGNPNLAPPGQEKSSDLEWVHHYKGHRLYNRQSQGRWEWNYDFHPVPGEMFFSPQELQEGRRAGRGTVIIEPNLPRWKTVSSNKDWGAHRYAALASSLRMHGIRLSQFVYGREPTLPGVAPIKTTSFRDAIALMANTWLYVGPEGGLHHAAAAVSIPAVVLFGGFVPPSVTGYDTHTNLTGGATACGSLSKCEHCRVAMAAITVEEVASAVKDLLKKGGRIT